MPRSRRTARKRSAARSSRDSAKSRRRGVTAAGDTSARSVPLSERQLHVLELIARGAPLVKTLESLVLLIEGDVPGMLGSVLLLDDEGKHVRHGAAPSLPTEYCEAIDGAAIGPRAGSCGTAAYRNESVVTEDIRRDPLWTDYRAHAEPHGLRACWSNPIRDPAGRVLGTFAMYFREPRRPDARHLRLIEVATHTAAIAIIKARGERERARVQAALAASETVFRSIFENAAIGMTMVDMETSFVRCNPAFARLLGYSEQELIGRKFSEFTHPEDVDSNQHLYSAMRSGEIGHFQLQKRYFRKDGRTIWAQLTVSAVSLAGSQARHTIGMVEDITARKEAEARIGHLAYHDPLTDLPNRASLQERLAQGVQKARAGGHLLALLLMNLHGFRDINNTLGHLNGDRLLREVAARLREALWQSDLVASLGGDEYAILLGRLASRDDIDLVMDKIAATLRRPVTIAGIPVNLEASLGVALYPTHGETPETLWQHADVALRAARERVVGRLFYSQELDRFDPRRLALLGELGEAIARDQLVLHFQPKIDLKRKRAVAVEALVRWKHPEHGLLYPDRFVPLAERTQLINPLTTWVLANALRQGRAWEQAGIPLWISVNLSARNLHNPNLGVEVIDLARSSRFPLERLTLEITESAIMAEPELAKKVLAELHGAGIHLSMDDFGIGQSSLAYLRDLPISKMKIDKSFVTGIAEPRNAALVRSAIELGHNFQLEVTAEGVEDQRACETLWLFGCEIGQGYYFAKPMPADQATAWLKESPWAVAGGGATAAEG